MTDLIIRTATPEDAQALLAIYTPYVTDTTITFEYDVPALDEFRQRIANTLMKYPYLVAEEKDVILGYAYASAFKTRSAYDWAVETSIYVKQGCHGRGVGKLLYTRLDALLEKQHIYSVNACITYPNDESIRFHEKMGYQTCAHFHQCGYKFGRWLDVIWMEKHLKIASPPQAFVPFSDLEKNA